MQADSFRLQIATVLYKLAGLLKRNAHLQNAKLLKFTQGLHLVRIGA